MAKFPHIVANIGEKNDSEGIRTAVYHALVNAQKPTAAKSFAETTAGIMEDRGAVLSEARALVSLTFSGGAIVDNAYDLEDASLADGLAVIAWRGLHVPGGTQDRAQGNGPPSVTSSHWMVTIDDTHGEEPLDNFMRRASAAGWRVTSSTPLGTVEQNSDTETWIPGLNLRDTRFSRVLTQMLFLHRDPTADQPDTEASS